MATFVGSAKYTPVLGATGSATSRTVAMSSLVDAAGNSVTAQAGDFIFVQIGTASSAVANEPTVSGMSNLDLLAEQEGSGHDHNLYIKTLVTADLTATLTVATAVALRVPVQIAVYRGVPAHTPGAAPGSSGSAIDAVGTVFGSAAGSTTITDPTVTTVSSSSVEIHFAVASQQAGLTSLSLATSGLVKVTDVYDPGTGGGNASAAIWHNLTNALPVGSTPGGDAWTANTAVVLSAITVALKNAVGASSSRPANSGTTAGWTASTGTSIATLLADDLDTTYAQSAANPDGTQPLETIAYTPVLRTGVPVTVKERYSTDVAGSVSVTLEIRQGATTVIASRTLTVTGTTPVDVTLTAPANLVTDPATLRVVGAGPRRLMVALRIYRSELTAADTAVSLRVYRSEMFTDAADVAQPVRLRVYRSELTTLPGVVLPATVTADSFKLVSLTATMDDGTAPSQWQWQQTAGPTVSTSGGSTSVLSFTAPPTTTAQTYTFQARALTASGFTDWRSVSVTVTAHKLWSGPGAPLETPQDRAQLGAIPPQPSESTPPVTPPSDPGPVDPTTPPPTGTPTTGLFFQMRTDLASFPRKSFPHYFPPYVKDFNNNGGTTYETNYNKVNGSATYTPDGGFIRNRMLVTAPRPTLTNAENLIRNAKIEIEEALAAGHDGFFCEILGLSGGNYDRLTALRSAAASYPGFLLIPMIDANGATGIAVRGQTTPTVVAKDPVAVANQMKLYLNLPSTYRLPNGRFLIATFKHEGNTAADWQAVLDNMGTPSAIGGIFLDYNGKSPNYTAQLTLGLSGMWGYGGDPVPISRAGVAGQPGALPRPAVVRGDQPAERPPKPGMVGRSLRDRGFLSVLAARHPRRR